jgi:CheY-like chemotaxis protein
MTTAPSVRETKQILLVEDDEDSRRALTNVLEDEGFSVAAVSSCEAALDYLRESPRPKLIVLDLIMQGMKGWEFRDAQKRDPELAGIPIVSVSAAGKLVHVDVALQKPVDYDELVKAVERYVTRQRERGTENRASDRSPSRRS